jgi:hypothetical protein
MAVEPAADGALTGATVAAGTLDALNAGAAADADTTSLALTASLVLAAG